MTPERLGKVELQLPTRRVTLQFTWTAIDALGRNGVQQAFARAESGEPGDLGALADLIAVASNGAVTALDVMAEPPPIAAALAAVLDAWMLAVHGPAREPAEGQEPGDPSSFRQTWWRRLWAKRSVRA